MNTIKIGDYVVITENPVYPGHTGIVGQVTRIGRSPFGDMYEVAHEGPSGGHCEFPLNDKCIIPATVEKLQEMIAAKLEEAAKLNDKLRLVMVPTIPKDTVCPDCDSGINRLRGEFHFDDAGRATATTIVCCECGNEFG